MAHSTFRRIGDEEGTEAALKVGEIMEMRGEFVSPRFNSSTVQYFFLGKPFFIANLWGFGGGEKEKRDYIYHLERGSVFFFWGGISDVGILSVAFRRQFPCENFLTWTSRKWWMSCFFFFCEKTIIQTGGVLQYWSNGLTSPSDHPSTDMGRLRAFFFMLMCGKNALSIFIFILNTQSHYG